MAVEILTGTCGRAVMFCNTTDTALGPVFASADHADDFIRWVAEGGAARRAVAPHPMLAGDDPRDFHPGALELLHRCWREERCDGDGNLLSDGPDVETQAATLADAARKVMLERGLTAGRALPIAWDDLDCAPPPAIVQRAYELLGAVA